MARPRNGYKLSDGTKAPGVTTIIKSLGSYEGLIFWSWELGMQGKDYRKVRDDAADAGTLGHDCIEAEIRGTPFPELGGEIGAKAANVLARFRNWRDQTGAIVSAHETPMVSEKYRFGGTPDATAIIGGKRVLLDWKSSARVYGEYLAQLGGYSLLLEECEGWMPEEAHLLRFDKTCEAWTHHQWGPQALELGRQAFLAALAVYPFKELLKKAVG